jgi:chemotaxis protein histidine kinase CheA
MTASPPQVNGSTRPTMPVIGDWRPITPDPEPVEEQRNPEPPAAAVESDAVAKAQAEAIRAQAWADAEAKRIAAEAAAKAELVKAEEEARKQKIANDRAEARFEEEQAARAARIAKANKDRADAERAEAAAAEQGEADKKAKEAAVEEIAAADDKWRSYALNFYRVCAIVALPVQLNAFYDPDALWLMAAPLMLEGGAWVVQKGAASAVANGRPSWHYRMIAWLLAFIAAGINLWHGLNAFDPATALGTAFASIAGPGVWDLHEHGRIRRRDGVLTRRERKTQEKAAKAEARRKAAEEAQRAAEKEAADKAAEEARQTLLGERQREFPKVWAEAVKIGAALGKAPDDPAVWPRAYRNIEGTEPGESIESITARRAAEKRVEAALSGTPVSTLSKTTNAQRAIQIKNRSRQSAYKPVPPVRQPGDTQPYHPAARRAHGETKRRLNARQKDQ